MADEKDKKRDAGFSVSVKRLSDSERVLRFTGTTDVKDRTGEILEADSWKLKNYRKNPVFLLAHDYRSLPIGKTVNIEQTKKGLVFDVEFADQETYALADTVFKLYEGGFMSGVSVGYKPNWDKVDVIDNVPHFKENELLELSAAAVPANPEALMQRMFEAEQKGVVNRQEIMELTLAAKSFFSGMKKAASTKPVDPPEIKSGRVLSKANEKLLRDAVESVAKATETITKVLDKVAIQPEEPKTEKYPSFKGVYDNLFQKKAVPKSGNVELIDTTLIEGMKDLNKKEK